MGKYPKRRKNMSLVFIFYHFVMFQFWKIYHCLLVNLENIYKSSDIVFDCLLVISIIVFLYYMLLFVFLLLHMYCVRDYNKKFEVSQAKCSYDFKKKLFYKLWHYYCTSYITFETKEVVRIGYNGFLFPHLYSVTGLGAMHLPSIVLYLIHIALVKWKPFTNTYSC